MKVKFKYSFVLSSIVLFLSVTDAMASDSEKENKNPIHITKASSAARLAYEFLSETFDQEELARFKQKDISPRQAYPTTLFLVVSRSEDYARRIKASTNLHAKDIPTVVFRALKKLGRPQDIDPLRVFALLDALYRSIGYEAPQRSQIAFTLMARMVMDAPRFYFMENVKKRNKGSFNYFGHCADECADMIAKEDDSSYELIDYWQVYFFDEAYPYVLSWLSPLYFFYLREAAWMEEVQDPFSAEEMPGLIVKIKSVDSFYDEDAICRDMQFPLGESIFNCLLQLNEYRIKDINIYWRLLPKLVGKSIEVQREFAEIMKAAGADELTIIDNLGQTGLTLAKKLHLDGVLRVIDTRAKRKQDPQSTGPNMSAEHAKRRCLRPIEKPTKNEKIVSAPEQHFFPSLTCQEVLLQDFQ